MTLNCFGRRWFEYLFRFVRFRFLVVIVVVVDFEPEFLRILFNALLLWWCWTLNGIVHWVSSYDKAWNGHEPIAIDNAVFQCAGANLLCVWMIRNKKKLNEQGIQEKSSNRMNCHLIRIFSFRLKSESMFGARHYTSSKNTSHQTKCNLFRMLCRLVCGSSHSKSINNECNSMTNRCMHFYSASFV